LTADAVWFLGAAEEAWPANGAAHPLLPIALTIAGVDAEILYAGSAPELIGVLQINARVPGGFVPAGQAAVVLTVGTAAAPAVTVWLK